jgi:hypothetical protein
MKWDVAAVVFGKGLFQITLDWQVASQSRSTF